MAAAYCYLGIAMNVSFSVASDSGGHELAAFLWLGGFLGSVIISAGSAVAAWRQRDRTRGP
jgi:hypothetical protein